MRRAVMAFVVAALGACDDAADGRDAQGDAQDSDGESEVDPCELAPVLTWDNFGAGFLVENCQPCHASGAVDRHDAPRAVVFDTRADAAARADRILERAVNVPEMPPAGGVSAADRALLEAWVLCDLSRDR